MTPTHPMGPLPRAKSWLLALYLGTGPVQWLPGVDYEWMARGKVLLFTLAVGLVFAATLPRRLRVPGGLAGPLGFMALAALAVPGLAQSSLVLSAGYVGDVVAGAAMLWCFYNVARLDPVAARFILDRSAMILGAFGVLALVLALAGLGWQSSCAPATFRDTAFGCSRTGWSGGLALYLPVLLVFAFRRDIGVPRRWLYLALAGGVPAAQAGVGGRAGLVASFVVVAVFVYYFMPRRWKVLGSAVALLAAAAVTIPTTLYEQLRLDEIPENPTSLMDWNYVSSGRVGGALQAAGYIAERPLAGHGIEAVRAEFRGGRPEIHNLWLKWAAYCGVLAPLLFLGFVIMLLAQSRRLAHLVDRHRSVAVAAGLVIVAGLVLSMLEPGTPFGEFQNNALWWAAAGLIVGMASRHPEPGGRWRRWPLAGKPAGQVSDRTGAPITCAACAAWSRFLTRAVSRRRRLDSHGFWTRSVIVARTARATWCEVDGGGLGHVRLAAIDLSRTAIGRSSRTTAPWCSRTTARFSTSAGGTRPASTTVSLSRLPASGFAPFLSTRCGFPCVATWPSARRSRTGWIRPASCAYCAFSTAASTRRSRPGSQTARRTSPSTRVCWPVVRIRNRTRRRPRLRRGVVEPSRRSHERGLATLLHCGDAISMAHLIESRLPFPDRRRAECVFSLPGEYKLRYGRGKALLREAVRGDVPDAILGDRSKLGFAVPIRDWFRSQPDETVLPVLPGARCRERGLINPKALERALGRHTLGRVDLSNRIFRWLTLELWCRDVLDGA